MFVLLFPSSRPELATKQVLIYFSLYVLIGSLSMHFFKIDVTAIDEIN